MNDAEVLAWLDRLLDLEPTERAATLEPLSKDRPELHARLVRLLHAALTEESSQMLARVMREGIAAVLHPRGSVPSNAIRPWWATDCCEPGRGGIAAVWLAGCVDGLVEDPAAVRGQPFPQVIEDRGRAALDVPGRLRLFLRELCRRRSIRKANRGDPRALGSTLCIGKGVIELPIQGENP